MNAFFVVMLVLATADGTPVMQPRLYVPMKNMEACVEFLKDPTPVEWYFGGGLKVVDYRFGCMHRGEGEGT